MKKQMFKVSLVMLGLISLTSCYDFNREQAEKDAESKGKQTLLEAESSKKAKIEEAKAEKESASLQAETKRIKAESEAVARMIRVKSESEALKIKSEADAKAIEVISKAVQSNPDYLKFKSIEAMRYGQTVYVPTEANAPILLK